MSPESVAAWGAIIANMALSLKALWDNKTMRRWICTRQPCDNRLKGEPPPE